uniref:Uncharacterized protein n=1 Tax=Anopheles atroparvus TaxID=41427 RepID=A0A182JM25_ANOAO
MYRHLHGEKFTTHRKSVPCFAGHCRSVRRIPRHDVCRRERSARVLDIRGSVLRHLGCVRRDVFNRFHP